MWCRKNTFGVPLTYEADICPVTTATWRSINAKLERNIEIHTQTFDEKAQKRRAELDADKTITR